MSFKHITSRDNPIFKQLKKFSDHAKERRSENKTLLDGVHLIESYMAIFGLPDVVIIPEGKSSIEATHLMHELAEVSTVMLPTLMFSELTPVANSTGILALVKMPQLPLPEHPEFVLMLEDIQDPGNMGSILRTAAASGVEVVYLSTGCTDVWSPKALRGGQGAQFVLPVVERADLVNEIKAFDGNCYATTMQGESLYSQNLTLPSAFLIGNEGAGLRPETIAATSKQISIPMQTDSVESLNAGVAVAVCLFERVRQIKSKN
ncbi:MAG: RNA methyltransferase [Betaproteobacteria bacterium]|nr:RNA methyltransferase [Betaproteobacteria bacterium]